MCGICGSDIHQLRDGWGFKPGAVAGHEWSGTIAAVGDDVTRWSVGELVVGGASPKCGTCRRCREKGKPSQCENRQSMTGEHTDGAFAEYILVREAGVLRLPEGLLPRHAALAEPLSVALHGHASASPPATPSWCSGPGRSAPSVSWRCNRWASRTSPWWSRTRAGAERDKALDVALSQIEKQFGKGSVMRMGENLNMGIESIPTGAMALDMALGIGGLPRGRIVEVYGPESSGKSTLAMHVVAEAQRNGGICAYIDAEHAMDPVYASAIGVNIDDLLISQPDTGEQALEIADMLIRSGALDVIVIDSVAALTPRAEIEGDMGDAHVGLQARLMSQALRKLTGTLSKSDTIALFINQLREKIGVMYGCFHYSTRVVLADGTTEKIGKIVNQRLPVEVLSYDPKVGRRRSQASRQLVRQRRDRQVPPVHRGQAGEERGGAVRLHPQPPDPDAGRVAGGGRAEGRRQRHDLRCRTTCRPSSGRHCAGPSWATARCPRPRAATPPGSGTRHCERQIAVRRLEGLSVRQRRQSPARPQGRRGDLRLHAAPGAGRAAPVGLHRRQEDLRRRLPEEPDAACRWPSGTWTTHRSPSARKGKQTRSGGGHRPRRRSASRPWSQPRGQRLVDYLADTWGIRAKLVASGQTRKAVLVFPTEETTKLHALIAPFVHPSMEYKLLPQFRGRFAVEPVFVSPMRYELVAMPVTDIHVKPPTRSMHRFDIEVEDSHNYLVDGVVVHNSPEVTPGGRALKFYSSVRLDIRRIEAIKDGADVIGSRTRVKVVKNKVLVPFKQAEFDIMYGTGHQPRGLSPRRRRGARLHQEVRGLVHLRG